MLFILFAVKRAQPNLRTAYCARQVWEPWHTPYDVISKALPDNPHIHFFESRHRGYVSVDVARARLEGARSPIALWDLQKVQERLTADALQPIKKVNLAANALQRESPRIALPRQI